MESTVTEKRPSSPSPSLASDDFLILSDGEKPLDRQIPLFHRIRHAACGLWRLFRPRTLLKGPSSGPARTSQTASYDGLRGIACLIVFNFHFLYPYTTTITHGFAVQLENHPDYRYPHQLPFLCLLVRGRAMVMLFFAISGYVLSYSFLATTHSDAAYRLKGFSRLTSLALRRWIRLFVPATISMLLVMIAAFLGAFEAGRYFQKSSEWLTGTPEQHPPRAPTFSQQIADFSKMWWIWSSPWSWRLDFPLYDPHTYTIGVEFRASLVLFVLLLASANLKPYARLILLINVTIFCLISARWDAAAFTSGAVAAYTHILESHRSSSLPSSTPLRGWPLSNSTRNLLYKIFKVFVLLTSLHVLSFPDNFAEKTPGYRFLASLTPSGYNVPGSEAMKFWHALASGFVIWLLPLLSPLQALCCHWIPQYFGKISYAFYLVHGPLLHSIGFAVQPWLFDVVGATDSMAKWVGCLVVGWAGMLALSVVVAHGFRKVVDVPLVQAAKWLEGKVSG